ncbi:MAG TPA: hypothetical protein VLH09_12520 [Bryobacteraceae bacterium]|nr:hypothetical protein [Bryobacteraceae bacterium]
MRRAPIFLAAFGGLLAQSGIAPPLAGFIRDGAGALRPVYGMTGNLALGEPIAQGVVEAIFDGQVGLARTQDAIYAFDSGGHLFGPVPVEWEAPALPIAAEGDELVYRRADGSELRAKVEGEMLAIERMGEAWYGVHQADRRLAVRVLEDRMEISRLPEAAQ